MDENKRFAKILNAFKKTFTIVGEKLKSLAPYTGKITASLRQISDKFRKKKLTSENETGAFAESNSFVNKLTSSFKKLLPQIRSILERSKGSPKFKQAYEQTKSISINLIEKIKNTKFSRELFDKWTTKIKNFNRDDLKSIDYTKFIDAFERFTKKKRSKSAVTAVTLFLSAYFLADLTSVILENFIPEPQKKLGSSQVIERKTRNYEQVASIADRNLFNSLGRIPGETATSGGDQNNEPTKTSLPFNLVGTVILLDEFKSIATIEDKTVSMVYPVRIDDEIPSKAKILKIESHKVIFINKSSGQREYIDLPLDGTKAFVLESKTTSTKKPGGPGVEKLSPTQFNVSRTEIDKSLSNFNEILTQARCVPNFENGVADGFKCFQIVPGSIYDKLGMQNGDVLCGYNGQAIDLTKVAEMINDLKTTSSIELCLKRDGQKRTFNYEIR